jgi:hypothetical protein
MNLPFPAAICEKETDAANGRHNNTPRAPAMNLV